MIYSNIILMSAARITVTLPPDLVEEIDRRERNRSRFILEAVRREVARRRREELRRSLARPHPEAIELAEAGLEEWGGRSSNRQASGILDAAFEKRVRWVAGKGWAPARK
jgi:hypothetical protein